MTDTPTNLTILNTKKPQGMGTKAGAAKFLRDLADSVENDSPPGEVKTVAVVYIGNGDDLSTRVAFDNVNLTERVGLLQIAIHDEITTSKG